MNKKIEKLAIIAIAVTVVFINIFVNALIGFILWNSVIAVLFNLPLMSYLQAVGIKTFIMAMMPPKVLSFLNKKED